MRRAPGFSLLELVVVLSIFALVAVIGVQVIQSTVRSSDRLVEVSAESGELALALALLRQDLNAAMPRLFLPAGGGQEPALKLGPGPQFSLTRGGLARLRTGASGFGRVTWRYDPTGGKLLRSVQTTLNPGRARVPEVVVLDEVAGLDLFSFAARSGWQPGFAADPRHPEALPLGLRVRVAHTRGDLDIVASLR